jgi:hypothetical protein
MEGPPLRNDAVFSSPPLEGKTGQDLQTTPFHQNWTRARFHLQSYHKDSGTADGAHTGPRPTLLVTSVDHPY